MKPNIDKTCSTCRHCSALIMMFNSTFGICEIRNGDKMLNRAGCDYHDRKRLFKEEEKK